MSDLKVGFGRVNVNPPMGIELAGYYIVRKADGIADDIEINAVAVGDKNAKAVIMALDAESITNEASEVIGNYVSERLGIPRAAVYLHATHSHTTPCQRMSGEYPLESEYVEFLKKRFADAAFFAVEDMKPAKMGVGIGKAENISFLRRFRMKDGSVATNPGVNNPDVVAPIGEVDEQVNVVRFDRENAETVIIANFGTHPDTIGGNKISADWPGFTRRYVEKAIDNTKCMFLNGAEGDVNHVNVFPKGGDLNGMITDFDDVSRGYGHAKHMGRVVAGAIMSVYGKVEYLRNTDVSFRSKTIQLPSNMPTADELPLAHRYNDLHNAGRDGEIPFKGMALTTVVAEAQRMVGLENGPEFFPLELAAIKVGDVAFVGIPGEPFTGIGLGIKEAPGYKMICPTCLTNGMLGYFPMREAYDEGGYETRSSDFKSGCAELIIAHAKELLTELTEKRSS